MRERISSTCWRVVPPLLALMAVGGCLLVLYFFDPATHGFYPVCVFHQWTGLECPGCGTLRALHQLSHGNFAAAWGLNPLVVSLLPVGFWLALREAVRLTTGRQWPGVVTRPIFGWIALGAMLAFGVLRNLPVWH